MSTFYFIKNLNGFFVRKKYFNHTHTFYTWIDFRCTSNIKKNKNRIRNGQKIENNSNSVNRIPMNETQLNCRVKEVRWKNCCQCQSIVVYIISIGHLIFAESEWKKSIVKKRKREIEICLNILLVYFQSASFFLHYTILLIHNTFIDFVELSSLLPVLVFILRENFACEELKSI